MPEQPEPWIERKLREAIEAGEFDDLPGKGEPIADIDVPYDADWWVRKWWERNRALDESNALAAEIQRRLLLVLAHRDENEVRAGLEELRAFVADAGHGGQLSVPVDELLAAWRERRSRRSGRGHPA